MKSRTNILLGAAVALNFALAAWILATRHAPEEPSGGPAPAAHRDVAALREVVQELRSEVRDLRDATAIPAAPPAAAAGRPAPEMAARLESLESSLAKLQHAMDGVSIEAASAERAELFAGEDGHLKADEYFEAGKFAIAGEGYLRFLEHHPDHPDHRNILERARNAFSRAGYMDKALWAQEELMRIYPENRPRELMTLAHLEKDAKRYGEAARHAEESAQLLESDERYWNLLYAAWFTQLADGNAAGLDYYRNVERQIIDAGYGEQKLGNRVREKIEELERQVAGGN